MLLCIYEFKLYILIVFFFFFQAEDGIRDHCVTGVQTCALPIYQLFLAMAYRKVKRDGEAEKAYQRAAEAKKRLKLTPDQERSEERRVGKECRSRWSP